MSDASPAKTVFSMRIVSLDYQMAPPQTQLDVCYSSFNGQSVKYVPIVRIFGSTPSGQKCCLHLHKTFPYFFIRIPESEPLHQIDDFLRRLSVSIERAVKVSFGANGTKEEQFIHSICLVKGKPFYGFYACPMLFLRVFIYNPQYLTRIVNLLRSGAIMGKQFEIYEAHVPYLLQVCIDYGLYGMNLIHLSSVQFRRPLPINHHIFKTNDISCTNGIFDTQKVSNQIWTISTIPNDSISIFKKSSRCELEVDGFAEDITNISDSYNTPPLTSDPRFEMIVKSLASFWKEERERRKENNLEPNPTPEDSGQEDIQNENWAVHTPSSLEEHLHTKLDRLLEIDAKRYNRKSSTNNIDDNESESLNESQTAFDFSPKSNLTYEQLIKHQSRNNSSNLAPAPDSLNVPIASQYQPFVDEEFVLSQNSDLETFKILNAMEDIESDEELNSSDDEENRTSQQEIKDIIESSLAVHDSESEPFLFDSQGRFIEENNDIIMDDINIKSNTSFISSLPIRDIEDLISQPEDLFSSPDILPQLDGSNDDFPPPRRKYRRRKDSGKQRRYCSLFEPPIEPTVVPTTTITTTKDKTSSNSKKRKHSKRKKRSNSTRKVHKSSSSTIFPPVNVESDVILIPATPSNEVPSSKKNSNDLVDSKDNIKIFKKENTSIQIPSNDIDNELCLVPGTPEPDDDGADNTDFYYKSPVIYKKEKEEMEDDNEITQSVVLPLNLWSPSSNTKGPFLDDKFNNQLSSCTTTVNNFNYTLSPSINMPNIQSSNIHDFQSSVNIFPSYSQSKSKNELIEYEYTSNDIIPETYQSKELVENNDDDSNSFQSLNAVTLKYKPPKSSGILDSLSEYNLPSVEYQEPFYDNQKDAPYKPYIFAGRTFKIPINNINNLPVFSPILRDGTISTYKGIEYWNLLYNDTTNISKSKLKAVSLLKKPPSRLEVEKWLKDNKDKEFELNTPKDPSQIDGPLNLDESDKIIDLKTSDKLVQYLTVTSVEIHVNTRGSLEPNPNLDSVSFICIFSQNDYEPSEDSEFPSTLEIITVTDNLLYDNSEYSKFGYLDKTPFGVKIHKVPSEEMLFALFIDIIHKNDPDILVGYEIQSSSWGYLIERASVLHLNLISELSRMSKDFKTEEDIRRDQWGFTHGTGIKITGRILLNLWRILRSEVKSNIYTFENMAFKVLNQRYPYYSNETITKWFSQKPGLNFDIAAFWNSFRYICKKQLQILKY